MKEAKWIAVVVIVASFLVTWTKLSPPEQASVLEFNRQWAISGASLGLLSNEVSQEFGHPDRISQMTGNHGSSKVLQFERRRIYLVLSARELRVCRVVGQSLEKDGRQVVAAGQDRASVRRLLGEPVLSSGKPWLLDVDWLSNAALSDRYEQPGSVDVSIYYSKPPTGAEPKVVFVELNCRDPKVWRDEN